MSYLDDIIAERENMITRGEVPPPLPYVPNENFGLAAAHDQFTKQLAEQEAWDNFVGKTPPSALDENGEPIEQPQENTTWGGFRGFAAGGVGAVRDQMRLANLFGVGDGSTANALEEVMNKNARKKEYTIGDMLPFASDYWTNGEGAAYGIGNALGSSAVFGAEMAAIMATGGAALGTVGVGGASAATGLARTAGAINAITGGMSRAAAKIGMSKLAKVLEGPMGKLYAANILTTPLEASSEAGNAGAEALANGASLDDAQRQALIVGGLQMPLLALSNTLESAGLGKLFLKEAEKAAGKKLSKQSLLKILDNVTRAGMVNAWEEGMQQSTHEYAAGKQSLLGVVNPFQWSDEAKLQAAEGGIAGSFIGGGHAGMRIFLDNREQQQAAAEQAAAAAPSPAQQARDFLDEIGQADNLTQEQKENLWQIAESGDDEAVMALATQLGWQNSEGQQQQEQPQPAPVTPETSPQDQIQTATDAVNATTENVVNDGAVVDGGEQGIAPNAQQPTQQTTQQPTQQTTQQPAGTTTTPASVPAQTATLVNDAVSKLMANAIGKVKEGDYKALINGNNTVDIDRLRKQFNIKRFINDFPDAVAVAQAAIDGDKAAITQFRKYKPERQLGILDAALNGTDNWQYTEKELQKIQNDIRSAVERHVTQIRQEMKNKVEGKKKLKDLTLEQKNELLSAASNSDLGKLIEVAEKYKIKVPKAAAEYYEQHKGDGSTPVTVKVNVGSKSQPKPTGGGKNTGSSTANKVDKSGDSNPNKVDKSDKGDVGNVENGGAQADTSNGENSNVDNNDVSSINQQADGQSQQVDNQNTNGSDNQGNSTSDSTGDTSSNSDNTDNREENKIPEKLGEKTRDPKAKKNPVFKTDDGKVKYTLNPKTNEVTRRIGKEKSKKEKFTSLKEAMNFIASDDIADEGKPWIRSVIGNFVTDKNGDNDSTSHDYYRLNGISDKGIDSARVTKHIFATSKDGKPTKVEYGVMFYDKNGDILDACHVKTLDEVHEILVSEGEATKGEDNNETDENGKGQSGTGEDNQNPVQGQQSKEPVETQTSDNGSKRENGETKVDKNENGETEEPAKKSAKKKTAQPNTTETSKEEAVSLDKVLEKYKDNADDRGIIRRLTGVDKLDVPIAKQYNSVTMKQLGDEIMQKLSNGAIELAEAHEQMKKLNSAYSQSSSIFGEADGVNGKKYVAELVKKLKSDIGNAATLAKENRKAALTKAEATSKQLIQDFKEQKKEFDETIESIKKLKDDIIAEFKKLGVKELGVAERKSFYDKAVKEVGDIQKARATEQRTDVQQPSKGTNTSNIDGEQSTPAKTVKERLTALEELENEFRDSLTDNADEALLNEKRIESKASPLFVVGKDLSDKEKEIVLAAKDKFKAGLKLAIAQNKADIAGDAVNKKNKPHADEVSDAISGFVDTVTFGDSSSIQIKAQNIILKSFTSEEQETLKKQDLKALGQELVDVFDDKDEFSDFITDATQDLDRDTADLLTKYLNRLRDGFAKADNIYRLSDRYDAKANRLAELQKGSKYSARVGGKLGESLYQAAWHGTPHIIKGNLTTERVGTGEGAIVHGWGLYFAKSRYISQTRYRDRLVEKNNSESKGELLKVEIPENDVLLNESKRFEQQPFRVRQALENIFSRLPSNVRPTEKWDAAMNTFQHLFTEEQFNNFNNDVMNELKKFNKYIVDENIDAATVRKLHNNLWNNVEKTVSDAVDKALEPLNKLAQEELKSRGKIKDYESFWYDLSNSLHKRLDKDIYNRLDSIGFIYEMGEFGFQETAENTKQTAVRNLLQRHRDEYYKPYALPSSTMNGKELLKGRKGYDIYGILGRALSRKRDLLDGELDWNDAKLASVELNRYGVKGIRYFGQTDGESFVVFNDNAIAIKQRYDAAMRNHGNELQRSRDEVVNKIKSMFAGSNFEEQENGDLLITTRNGNKILYKIADRIVLNEAEKREARKGHGIADEAEVFAEGRYRAVYEGDIDAMVEVGLNSRENTEAHETTHAVINLALGKEGSKPLFDRADKLIKEYGLKAGREEVACDAVRDFIIARENGFITTFTADERRQLSKTFWGRVMLKANTIGARAKVLSNGNEAELSRTTWGKALLVKLKVQRSLAKLMRSVYDFYQKFKSVRTANESFHNLAREIELGEVWNRRKGENINDTHDESSKYSASYARKGKDFTISSINLKYKEELEQAFERNATAGEITDIQNRHQNELAEYLKEKGEQQKEKAKLRAAELRELRKKLKAREIESFEMAGGRVTLDKDGKEKFESIKDPNELPTFVYKNTQHDNEAYQNASATQRLNASIRHPKSKGTVQTVKEYIKNAKDNFYKHWVDKYNALGILDEAIAKKGGKPADESLTILNQMQMSINYATGAARALIEGDENSLKPLTETWGFKNINSLKMILEKLESDHKGGKYSDRVKSSSLEGGTGIDDYLNYFESYLTASTLWESAQNHKLDYDREVAEWQKKGARGEKPKETPYKFPNSLTEEDIKQVIRSAPPEFKTYQKMFKGLTDNMLDIMAKSGLITSDRYDTLKDRYKFYCPLFRDFSDTEAVDSFISQINAGKGMANVSDPLKSRSSEGSHRDVMSPLTSAVKSISAICAKAERNRVGQYAVGQAKKYHLDDYVREIKGNTGDAKNCIFTVMINGEKHAYQTIPELYPAITAAVEPLCKLEFTLLTKPAQLLRAGSTLSPSFIIRNLLRDTVFAAASSKNGFIPVYDSIRGGVAYFRNKQLRGEYEAAGVVSSNYYSDSEAIMKSLNEMAGGKTWQEMTTADIVKAGLKYLIGRLELAGEAAENSTRMGEFMRAREKGKGIREAGHDAVEVSLNFNRSGATGQQINRVIPFFNACIQGGDKLYRLFKADPRRTMYQIAKYMILPSVALWWLNHDEDWYKEIDPSIKMTNWIVGGLRIPKPQEAGILFGSGIEAMLDTANSQDPKAMKEWRHNAIEALTPGFLPTVILPLIEWMANYSFFRGKPIVNQSMQRLPDELQYGSYTSETAKLIGKVAGLSPAKIDNLWRGYTGTMGMYVFQAPDLFMAEKQNLPKKKISEMVAVRDFIINDMNFNRTMNDFYELREAATKKQAAYSKKSKPTADVTGVNIAATSIQKLQKEIRDITNSQRYNSAQKRVMIDKLKAKQNKIAKAALKRYGNKFDD